MKDVKRENDILRQQDEFMLGFHQDMIEKMEASIRFWRNSYLTLAAQLYQGEDTVRDITSDTVRISLTHNRKVAGDKTHRGG